jgi:hypothetical protein
MFWRRGGDSNPRYRFCQYNCLAGSPVRPLQHLSAVSGKSRKSMLIVPDSQSKIQNVEERSQEPEARSQKDWEIQTHG